MIEKHLTLSRADGGPDAAFSLEPDEFAAMAKACREAAAALEECEHVGRAGTLDLNRSLWVVRPVVAGGLLALGANVRTARPNKGLPCEPGLAGAGAARDLNAGEPLTAECIAR